MNMKDRELLAKLMYEDMKANAVGEMIYTEIKPLMLDPVDLALMEYFKRGGEVKQLNYRKARKGEMLINTGVKVR